jgi:hypothetical protein
MGLFQLKEEEYPFSEEDFGYTELRPNYRIDLRNPTNDDLDKFINANLVSDWSQLTWKDVI